jgi:phosphoribosyl-ATP pyrophosphohydrolase/phosphoribosyl-AMP cyclohydrolase
MMNINFDRGENGLVPAIIQDAQTDKVLMLGYMNEEALNKTSKTGKVTFYSRGRRRLWTKGETSGNELIVQQILIDCDRDTILIKARPTGPVCHTGADTCFNETNMASLQFLSQLEHIIADRQRTPRKGSHTSSLFASGIPKIAQKVGEEATEVIIEAMRDDQQSLAEECADLLYHLLVLMQAKNLSVDKVADILAQRHQKK